MPDTVFLQATSNASAAAIEASEWTIELTGTTAGSTLMLFFVIDTDSVMDATVTDSLGNEWAFNIGGSFQNEWNTFPSPGVGGDCVVTIAITGGVIHSIAAALVEYGNVPVNFYFGLWAWGTPPGEQGNTFVMTGSGTALDCSGFNAVWKPNTFYDETSSMGPITCSDTSSPSQMQFCFNSGTSGASAPAWNDSGGETIDNTVTWDNLFNQETAEAAVVPMALMYRPFVEFLNPGPAWTMRTQASDANGIAVYDQFGEWNATYGVSVTKSADTYDLGVIFPDIPATRAAGAPVPQVFGTHVGFLTAGHFGGGTK